MRSERRNGRRRSKAAGRTERGRPRLPGLRVTAGFWAGLCALFCLCGGKTALPFLAAAGLHEAGHLAALGLLGIPVQAVELRLGGAVIRAELEGRFREVAAVLAGPWVNLLCAGLCFRLWPVFSLYSLVLFLYNLLPVYPLDGGRLCRLVLPRVLGRGGEILCKLLHWGTLAAALALGLRAAVQGRCLSPALPAVFFLLRLPMGLDKRRSDW